MKRLLDLLGSALGLLCLSPLLALVALLLKCTGHAPVIYAQKRPGLKERPFSICKFRTMRDLRGPDGRLLPDAERLTGLGRFLRRWSLDEFPQLWNVFKGEMSLVGPRPLLFRYLPRYSPRQRLRHNVKPGITGWAQVNGRNALDWERRLDMDVWYAEHASFWLDVKILLLTVVRVLSRSGVKPGAGAEIDEFWGNEKPTGAVFGASPTEEDERKLLAKGEGAHE